MYAINSWEAKYSEEQRILNVSNNKVVRFFLLHDDDDDDSGRMIIWWPYKISTQKFPPHIIVSSSYGQWNLTPFFYIFLLPAPRKPIGRDLVVILYCKCAVAPSAFTTHHFLPHHHHHQGHVTLVTGRALPNCNFFFLFSTAHIWAVPLLQKIGGEKGANGQWVGRLHRVIVANVWRANVKIIKKTANFNIWVVQTQQAFSAARSWCSLWGKIKIFCSKTQKIPQYSSHHAT